MSDKFFTLVVTAALAPLARGLAAGLSPRGEGMFASPLQVKGTTTVSHYISSGDIDEAIGALLTDADDLYAACVEAGATVTLEQCQMLVSTSDVSDENPYAVLDRLNLEKVPETLDDIPTPEPLPPRVLQRRFKDLLNPP